MELLKPSSGGIRPFTEEKRQMFDFNQNLRDLSSKGEGFVRI